MRDALRRTDCLDQALFTFFQESGIELLAQATDQSRGLASARRAQDQQAFIERKAEDLVLVLIENGLIAQPHLGDDAAAHAVDDVGLDGFFGQQLTQEVFGDFFSGNLSQ
ncbi:hypothetical protein D3C77_346110 [compost metagenome]